MLRQALIGVTAVGLLAAAPERVEARDAGSERLGTLRAGFERDRDDLEVERRGQRYWGLQLSSARGRINIERVEITFGNGRKKAFSVDRAVSEGRPAVYLDFGSQQGRRIDEVEVIHRTAGGNQKQQAVLRIDGEIARSAPAAGRFEDYQRLGIARIRPGSNGVSFNIDSAAGRVSELRFRAIGGTLNITSARVTYGNGKRDTLKIRDTLGDGQASAPADLEGRRRFVKQVDLAIADHSLRRGANWVEVWGREGRGRGNGRPGRDVVDIPRGWSEAGTLRVTGRRDIGTVEFGDARQRINGIGLMAVGRRVSIGDVTVSYRNGDRKRFRVDRDLRPRDGLLRIDTGDARRFRAVSVEYRGSRRQNDAGPGKLVMLVDPSGRGAGPVRPDRPGRADEWVLLGSKRAAMLSNDYDAIEVGSRSGRFRAIRITVRRQDIRIYGMQIVYGNGTTERVPIAGWVRKGAVSQVFDLKGRERIIKRIDIRYRTKLSLKGSGVIEVYGLR